MFLCTTTTGSSGSIKSVFPKGSKNENLKGAPSTEHGQPDILVVRHYRYHFLVDAAVAVAVAVIHSFCSFLLYCVVAYSVLMLMFDDIP